MDKNDLDRRIKFMKERAKDDLESDIGITSAVYKAFGCLGDDVDGDLISRSAAMEIVKRTSGDYAAAFSEIRRLPATDPEKMRPKAHWYDRGSLSCRCSACGCKNNRESRYCPSCGAKMEG